MKWSAEKPVEKGYYWYVDINNPEPDIVLVDGRKRIVRNNYPERFLDLIDRRPRFFGPLKEPVVPAKVKKSLEEVDECFCCHYEC